MFGDTTLLSNPELISFREHPAPEDRIPVYFVDKTLLFPTTSLSFFRNTTRPNLGSFSVSMTIGIIDFSY